MSSQATSFNQLKQQRRRSSTHILAGGTGSAGESGRSKKMLAGERDTVLMQESSRDTILMQNTRASFSEEPAANTGISYFNSYSSTDSTTPTNDLQGLEGLPLTRKKTVDRAKFLVAPTATAYSVNLDDAAYAHEQVYFEVEAETPASNAPIAALFQQEYVDQRQREYERQQEEFLIAQQQKQQQQQQLEIEQAEMMQQQIERQDQYEYPFQLHYDAAQMAMDHDLQQPNSQHQYLMNLNAKSSPQPSSNDQQQYMPQQRKSSASYASSGSASFNDDTASSLDSAFTVYSPTSSFAKNRKDSTAKRVSAAAASKEKNGAKGSSGPRRYCGNRLSRCQFVCVVMLALFFLVMAILIPVYYFAVIPRRLQASIEQKSSSQSGGGSDRGLQVQSLNFTDVTNTTATYFIEFSIPKISFIPGTGSLVGPTKFAFYHDATSTTNSIAFTVLPDLNFNLNQDSLQQIQSQFVVKDMDKFQKSLGHIAGFETLRLQTYWTLRIWGITWYSKLSLSAPYTLGRDPSTPIGGGGSSASDPTRKVSVFPQIVTTPDLNADIRKLYPSTSLLQIGGGLPDVRMGNISVAKPTNYRIIVTGRIEFENPTVVQINASTLTITLGSGLTPLVDVTLSHSDASTWQLSNRPPALGFNNRVMSSFFNITLNLRNTSSPGFTASFLSLSTALQTNTTILGPLDLASDDGGHLFGELTRFAVLPISSEKVQTAIMNVLNKLGGLVVPAAANAVSNATSALGNLANLL